MQFATQGTVSLLIVNFYEMSETKARVRSLLFTYPDNRKILTESVSSIRNGFRY